MLQSEQEKRGPKAWFNRTFLHRGHQLSTRGDLFRLSSPESALRKEQEANTRKLLGLLQDSQIDYRIHDNIFQDIFAPTDEYLSQTFPIIDEAGYGEFYTHPANVLFQPEFRDVILAHNSDRVRIAIYDNISIVNQQLEEGTDSVVFRWSPEEYQELIFIILPWLNQQIGIGLLKSYFSINDLCPNEQSGYNPLKRLIFDPEFKRHDYMRKIGLGKLREVIDAEEKEGQEPRVEHERALPIYKGIVYQMINESAVPNRYQFPWVEELEHLINLTEKPLFDNDFYLKFIMKRFRHQKGSNDLLVRQFMPSSDGEWSGFVINNKQDEAVVRDLLWGNFPYEYAYMKNYFRDMLTRWVVGDQPYAEDTQRERISQKARVNKPNQSFPGLPSPEALREELNNTGSPTTQI